MQEDILRIKYSIIVPVKEINSFIVDHSKNFESYTRTDLELIVLPNFYTPEFVWPTRFRVFETGRVSPSIKRDIGAGFARGEILVFLDDDAYVEESFFLILDNFFEENSSSCIGGPAVTPSSNSSRQKASGATFESRFLSSDANRYLPMRKSTSVDDWPSVNLSIPKSIFIEIGGFAETFWPGEDTMLCRKLKSFQVPIIYCPNALAFHHRRPTLQSHLQQVSGYGFHRGYFARRFPENSRKFKYFAPICFVLYIKLLFALIITNLLIGISLTLLVIAAIPGFTYIALLILAIFETYLRHSLSVALLSIIYFPASHLAYGIQFARGFLKNQRFQSSLR